MHIINNINWFVATAFDQEANEFLKAFDTLNLVSVSSVGNFSWTNVDIFLYLPTIKYEKKQVKNIIDNIVTIIGQNLKSFPIKKDGSVSFSIVLIKSIIWDNGILFLKASAKYKVNLDITPISLILKDLVDVENIDPSGL